MKFGKGEDATDPFDYGNVFERQHRDQERRLLIGPSNGHVETLLKLSACLDEPFVILYVLIVPNGSGKGREGRYESPELGRGDMEAFLVRYREFFEGDGRHNLWIAGIGATDGRILYDRHNFLCAYGPVPEYISVLADRGVGEGPVKIPSPHWHKYHPHFNPTERDLLAQWKWTKMQLEDGDES